MKFITYVILFLAFLTLVTPVSSKIPAVKIGCYDSLLRLKITNGSGKSVARSCEWAKRKFTKKRCALGGGAVAAACPVTCGTCTTCADPASGSDGLRFRFEKDEAFIVRSCDWVARGSVNLRCFLTGNICRKTCGACTES